MGKRSDFKRVERDFYPTPYDAVVPLLPHLDPDCTFIEPCAGAGDLVCHLEENNIQCLGKFDIEPRSHGTCDGDAIRAEDCKADMFITNPPYLWAVLEPIMKNLYNIAPTWLLLPADLMHNRRMAPHMARCQKVVSVGRVKWFGRGGMENSAWYLFDGDCETITRFYGRAA